MIYDGKSYEKTDKKTEKKWKKTEKKRKIANDIVK